VQQVQIIPLSINTYVYILRYSFMRIFFFYYAYVHSLSDFLFSSFDFFFVSLNMTWILSTALYECSILYLFLSLVVILCCCCSELCQCS